MKYRCPACGVILERDSKKMWVKSYCDVAGRTARLQRVMTIEITPIPKRKRVRCCDNGFFGTKHKCQKQSGPTFEIASMPMISKSEIINPRFERPTLKHKRRCRPGQ